MDFAWMVNMQTLDDDDDDLFDDELDYLSMYTQLFKDCTKGRIKRCKNMMIIEVQDSHKIPTI